MKAFAYFFLLFLVFLSCKEEKKPLIGNEEKIISNPLETSTISNGKLLHIANFPSKFISLRNVDIWLPDNYSENKKYAVLYMQDGQNLFDSTSTFNKQEWKVDEIASKLMQEGKTKDFIVVALWNSEKLRHSDYFPQKPFESLPKKTRDSLFLEAKKNNNGLQIESVNSDNYLKFIIQEVKPYVDANFPTLTDSKNTAIMGSSMGGLISMYAICEYPEVFGGAACLSTHWIGTYTNTNNPIPNAFFKYMVENLPDSKSHNLYFDYGTKTLDALYLPYQKIVDSLLNEKGYKTNLLFDKADHSENSWNKRLEFPLLFLLKND